MEIFVLSIGSKSIAYESEFLAVEQALIYIKNICEEFLDNLVDVELDDENYNYEPIYGEMMASWPMFRPVMKSKKEIYAKDWFEGIYGDEELNKQTLFYKITNITPNAIARSKEFGRGYGLDFMQKYKDLYFEYYKDKVGQVLKMVDASLQNGSVNFQSIVDLKETIDEMINKYIWLFLEIQIKSMSVNETFEYVPRF